MHGGASETDNHTSGVNVDEDFGVCKGILMPWTRNVRPFFFCLLQGNVGDVCLNLCPGVSIELYV